MASFAGIIAALALGATADQFVMYTPGGDDTSVERIDPILAPGSIGQHVHQVFGSNALAPEVTYEDLLASTCTTVADSDNHGNSFDHSIYWHPALYMEAANGTGYIKVPTNGHKLYYRDAGSSDDVKADPFEFPHGFRMIAGDAWLREPYSDLQEQNITQWICHAAEGMNQGTAGGFPTGVDNCAETDGFNGAIHFPHCWNGDAFDVANPQAHMAYPDGDIEEGKCPSSHPTRLPHIFIENTFNLDVVHDQVKPDTFVLAHGDNTGLGWHADFFNGWEDGAIPALLASCPYDFYGNEDVGLCSYFKATDTPADECDLKSYYPEKVYAPGDNLPGCNPIRDTNPAPIYAAAPLGTYSTDCTLAGNSSSSGSGTGSSSSVSAVSSATSTPATSSSESATVASSASAPVSSESTSSKSSETASTKTHKSHKSTSTSVAAESTSSSEKLSAYTRSAEASKVAKVTPAPLANPDDDVVTVTEWVTVTMGAPSKRHMAHHLRHRNHDIS